MCDECCDCDKDDFYDLNSWNWFSKVKPRPKHQHHLEILAQNRKDALAALVKDPSILFQVVNKNVTFLDLLIMYKTIREQDIIDMEQLDWYKLSSKLPLSNSTLEKYADKVDWSRISKSQFYKINLEFVKKFGNRLDWSVVTLYESTDTICDLVFKLEMMPFKFGIQQLTLHDALHYIDLIAKSKSYKALFLTTFGAKCSEDADLDVDPDGFAKKCIDEKYVPTKEKYIEMLSGYWNTFIICCNPSIEFIEKYIVKTDSCTTITWRYISSRVLTSDFIEKYRPHLDLIKVIQWNMLDTETIKQVLGNRKDFGFISKYTMLTPEYIDEYADTLDWYNLCEFQVLPEWLMTRHKRKLNWGQVSWYQKMSKGFITENAQWINQIKLENNDALLS